MHRGSGSEAELGLHSFLSEQGPGMVVRGRMGLVTTNQAAAANRHYPADSTELFIRPQLQLSLQSP